MLNDEGLYNSFFITNLFCDFCENNVDDFFKFINFDDSIDNEVGRKGGGEARDL